MCNVPKIFPFCQDTVYITKYDRKIYNTSTIVYKSFNQYCKKDIDVKLFFFNGEIINKKIIIHKFHLKLGFRKLCNATDPQI